MEPITILLIDDSVTFLHVASEFLHESSNGAVSVVATAETAASGIELAVTHRPQIILIDMKMPGVTGLDAIPRLRAEVPNAGIIALTLMDTNGYRQAAVAAGADEFVAKDRMGHDRLLPVIHRLLPRIAARREPGAVETPVEHT
jgi:DNA-binding NarL/FixJ family response regulator